MPTLRELLRARGLVSTGTRDVLLARLGEALEREAIQAFGGRRVLAGYAQNAVSVACVQVCSRMVCVEGGLDATV